jgi:signal transduction histidine kinase
MSEPKTIVFLPNMRNTLSMLLLERLLRATLIMLLCTLTPQSMGSVFANTAQSAQDSMIIRSEITVILRKSKKLAFKDIQQALQLTDSAFARATVYGNPSWMLLDIYRSKGLIYENNNLLNDARIAYQEGLKLAPMTHDTDKLAIYNDWAILNRKMGDYKTAKDYYLLTIDVAKHINDWEMVEYAYHGLGALYGTVGDFDNAVEYYWSSLGVAEKRNDPKNVLISLQNICSTYLKAKNTEAALKNVKKAYSMALQQNDSARIGDVQNIYGKTLLLTGQFAEALQRHEDALHIFQDLQDKRNIVECLINIADVYIHQNQYDIAESYFLKCNPYKDFFKSRDQAEFYYKFGDLYLKTQLNSEAALYFKKCLSICHTYHFKDIDQKANIALSGIYKTQGDFVNAYEYLAAANALGDSLFNEEKSRRLTEAQFKFDIEKAEARKEKEIESLKYQQSRILSIVLFIMFSILIIFLVYSVRTKTKANLVLKQKNEEIRSQNRRLKESNEILNQFAYVSAHDLKEPLRSIGNFVHIIQRRYMSLLPAEAANYMGYVTGGVKRMDALLTALLEYSTVASEGHEVTTAIKAKQIVKEVCENLRSAIESKQAEIFCKDDLPAMRVSHLHLTQLLQNTISNSLKFCEQKPSVRIETVLQKEEFWIKIMDNGIGIEAEYSDKVFKLFQRLSRQYEGTGIGLTICKNIVDKYNGRIWFESVVGEGTTFFIALPNGLLN